MSKWSFQPIIKGSGFVSNILEEAISPGHPGSLYWITRDRLHFELFSASDSYAKVNENQIRKSVLLIEIN